jgi:hypothetical protein
LVLPAAELGEQHQQQRDIDAGHDEPHQPGYGKIQGQMHTLGCSE